MGLTHHHEACGKPVDSFSPPGSVQVQKLFAESSDELTVAVEKQMEVGQKEEAEEQLAWDRVQEEGKHRSDRPQQMFPILGSILKLD